MAKIPIKQVFDKYLVIDVIDVWNEHSYKLSGVFQRFSRICKYPVVDDCGNDRVETRTTFFRNKLTSEKVLIKSRESEVRVNRYIKCSCHSSL